MFDYVIVGAGSAGCVLAHRLSEDPEVEVLLVEAGGDDSSPLIAMPAASTALLRTEKDWDLSTGYSMRVAYEKHWYDLDNASPDFDQFKIGFMMRY